jgi:hypothetical protein
MAEIANSNLGACRVCGVNIEQGEWAEVSKTLGVKHAGCISWRTENTIDAEGDTPTSGFLFNQPEQAAIDHAKEVLGVKTVSFDGASVLQIDAPRLSLQIAKVFELMSDGQYRTLRQIANAAECLETSASARLRDLRKVRFGSHTVEARQVEGVRPLTYEYRLILNESKKDDGQQQQNAA